MSNIYAFPEQGVSTFLKWHGMALLPGCDDTYRKCCERAFRAAKILVVGLINV